MAPADNFDFCNSNFFLHDTNYLLHNKNTATG